MSINQLVDNIEERLYSDGTVDNIAMIETADVIARVVAVVAGVLSWIIIILLPLVISLEIIYICFPFMREKSNELILKLEQRGHKHSIPGFILKDAIKAINMSEDMIVKGEGDNTGSSSALWIYIKLKLPAIFFIFFVLAFALQGTSTIIAILSRLANGILNMLY